MLNRTATKKDVLFLFFLSTLYTMLVFLVMLTRTSTLNEELETLRNQVTRTQIQLLREQNGKTEEAG